jgi:hypothetical protein
MRFLGVDEGIHRLIPILEDGSEFLVEHRCDDILNAGGSEPKGELTAAL